MESYRQFVTAKKTKKAKAAVEGANKRIRFFDLKLKAFFFFPRREPCFGHGEPHFRATSGELVLSSAASLSCFQLVLVGRLLDPLGCALLRSCASGRIAYFQLGVAKVRLGPSTRHCAWQHSAKCRCVRLRSSRLG